MKTHINSCRGYKNWVCRKCNKRFTTKGNVQQHLKSHGIGVQMFECTKCGIKFKYSQSFKKHIARCGS